MVINAVAERKYLNHLNAAWVIAEHLRKRSAVGTKNYLCGGHFISQIARNLGLFNELEMKNFSEPVIPMGTDITRFKHLREKKRENLLGLPEILDVKPINSFE